MGNEREQGARSPARAMRLANDVGKLISEAPLGLVQQLIAGVLDQVGDIVKELEDEHFAQGKRVVDATGLHVLMMQGALAAICEGHEDVDIRSRAYQAGRRVGDYWTERAKENVAASLEAERKKTES